MEGFLHGNGGVGGSLQGVIDALGAFWVFACLGFFFFLVFLQGCFGQRIFGGFYFSFMKFFTCLQTFVFIFYLRGF